MEFRLHLNFVRECMRTDKIGSKFRFFNFEKIRNKMAHVFALCLQISIHVMVVAVEGK